jgi:4-hydroxy-L-threonine phosphate dehydrogenase PdxA
LQGQILLSVAKSSIDTLYVRGGILDKPFIITMGDPAGIGPEIIVKALFSGALDKYAPRLIVGGDVAVLQRAAHIAGYTANANPGTADEAGLTCGERTLRIQPLSHLDLDATPFGSSSASNGRAMLEYFVWA